MNRSNSGSFKPRFGRLEFGSAIFFSVVFTVIIFASNARIQNYELYIQKIGTDLAKEEVRLLRRQFEGALDRVTLLEQNALLITHAYESHSPEFPGMLESLRKEATIAGPEFMNVTATDADGILQWSTLPNIEKGADFSDRDYFRKLSQETGNFYISSPILGKFDKMPIIPFAFARRDRNGHFQGLITVTITSDISKYLQNTLPDDRFSLVAIVRGDGQLLSRSIKSSSQSPPPRDDQLPKIMTQSVVEGSYSGFNVSPIDGIRRFIATAYIGQWNAILLVGLEPQPEMLQLNIIKQRITLEAIAASVLSLVATIVITALIRRQKMVKRVLELSRNVALRESVLLQIAEKATDMIALMDADFRYIYANDAYRRTLGLDVRKSIGKRMGHSLACKMQVEEAIEALARNGGSTRLLIEVTNAQGDAKWLDIELVSVDIRVDDFVSPCRYFGISRDVTERVRAEQGLVASKRRIENILHLGAGFFYELRIEANGTVHIDMPVDAGDRLLGYTLEEATQGGMLLRQTHPDDLPLRAAGLQRCIKTGRASVEFRVIAKDGSVHWMLRQLVLTRHDATGTEMIVFVTDISSEHAMRNRLRHSEQLATLGHLSASIAHEMNQPLASLMLAAENALSAIKRNNWTPEQMTARIERINDQVQRLSQLMNRVRQFSRNDQGCTTVFSLHFVINEALELCAARVRHAGVTTRIELDDDLPALLTDRLLLEQTLMNLIVNACDAYEAAAAAEVQDNKPMLISAKRRGEALIIRVADQAGGIAEHVRSQLFEAFVTTKPANQGTGLGLSVSAANIAQLGGEVSAHNAEGGAVFEIILPASLFA